MRHLHAFAAVLTVLACALPASAQVDETVERSIAVGSADRLVLDVDRGSIDVRAGGTDTVELEVRFRARESSRDQLQGLLEDFTLDVETSGTEVRVTGRLGRDFDWNWFGLRGRWLQGVEYHVTVPGRLAVDLQTRGGSVSVADIEGEAEARTSGGSLEFRRVGGRITGRTSGGSIQVFEAGQDVRVETSGGSIDVEQVAGDLDARTSGGSIDLDEVTGYATVRTSGGSIRVRRAGAGVDASTSGGRITADFRSRVDRDSRLSTSGGGITVTLGRDVGFDVDASGSRVDATDFGVTADGRRRNSLEAALNGGGPGLRLRSSGGTIRIRTGA